MPTETKLPHLPLEAHKRCFVAEPLHVTAQRFKTALYCGLRMRRQSGNYEFCDET